MPNVRPLRATTEDMPSRYRTATQQSLLPSDGYHTLGEAVSRYRLEHLLVDGLAPSTIAWREQALARLQRWAGRDVAGRWRDVAAQLYAEARREGRTEATPSLAVNTLSRVLRLARSWGWREDDHDLGGLCRVRSRRRTAALPADHLASIWAALRNLDERPRLHVACECARLLVLTGWRVGEGTSIRPEHVDERRACVHLPQTKTGPQTRAIADEALAVIVRQPRRGSYVFARRDGRLPINRRQVLTAWQLACDEARVPRYPLHLLRHTWATVGAQLELPTASLAPALGHTVEWQTTEYQHVTHDDVRRVAQRVASELLRRIAS